MIYKLIRIILMFCSVLFITCVSPYKSINLRTIESHKSPFYKNIISSINFYAVSFDGKAPLNQLNPEMFGNGKEGFIELLENGWFLNWKSTGGKLTECRRGLWAIDDSILVFKYLEISTKSTLMNDTVSFVSKKYFAEWPLYEVTTENIITKSKYDLIGSYPKELPKHPNISEPCKAVFPEIVD